MNRMLVSLLLARLLLVVAVVPHALSKITGWDAFLDKFGFVGPALGVLIILAELSGVAGLLAGAALPNGLGRWVTRAGLAGIAAVQIGAIVTVHGGAWFFFGRPPGMEYNVVLLGLVLLLAVSPQGLLGSTWPRRA